MHFLGFVSSTTSSRVADFIWHIFTHIAAANMSWAVGPPIDQGCLWAFQEPLLLPVTRRRQIMQSASCNFSGRFRCVPVQCGDKPRQRHRLSATAPEVAEQPRRPPARPLADAIERIGFEEGFHELYTLGETQIRGCKGMRDVLE